MTSSTSFAKLNAGILDSTLWFEPDRTRLVWITMLAMADQFGRVLASIPGLANRARVPIDDTRLAIQSFLAPDPDSRTKDFAGRRIEEIDGGWRLLNHAKYRDMRGDVDRREQNRQAQARARAKKHLASAAAIESQHASSVVSDGQHKSAESAHTDAEANTETDHSEAIASGGEPPSAPVSTADAIYALGIPILLTANVPDKSARSFLGLLRKQAKGTGGDEAVLSAIQRCADEQALQPVEFLMGCLKSAKTASGKHAGFATKNYREGVTTDGTFG